MTLLTVVQDAMQACGLSRPTLAFASADVTVQQFIRFAQMEGDNLMRSYDWPGVKTLATVTGDGSNTLFDLPAGFHRWIPGNAFYKDDSPLVPLNMVTDEAMRRYKEAAATPIYPVWRRFRDGIEFYPAPPNGDIYKAEYRTKYWIVDTDESTRKARWEADTDYSSLPESLLLLGCIWRFKRSKGFSSDTEYAEYRAALIDEISGETGRPVIKLSDGYGKRVGSDPKVTAVV